MSTTPPRKESEMTTNQERATEVVRDRLAQALWNGGPLFDSRKFPDAAAQALADAGLLMPDLPRPMEIIDSDSAKFNEHIDVLYGDVRVYFAGDFGEYPENLTPADAREQALELLAAADYAEQGQGNE